MRGLLLLLFLPIVYISHAQQNLTIKVISDDNKIPVRATIGIKGTIAGYTSDSTGFILISFPAPGNYTLLLSSIGYRAKEVPVSIPHPSDTLEIELQREHEELDEVVIQSTRTSRTIKNSPTRIEVISGEELSEKGNMKPGDIRMMLNESTGIQTQQTSATSFNSSIRIQGLEGRYTQLLRDGYPLYSGFAGGLSILQIAPLDLRQVEVIKGSASTLYGGGAIAGLVNLISKTPGEKREISFLANATSARGLDLSGFYSQRFKKTGVTIFSSHNRNAAFDPSAIGLTAIPKFERYTVHPRIFFYGIRTTANAGISYVSEDRIGGSTAYIRNGGNGFFEKNNTRRITSQVELAHPFSESLLLRLKNSYSRFSRWIMLPSYRFEAIQQTSFSEITLNYRQKKSDWVFGANFLTDDLEENRITADPVRDYHYTTFGLFIQNAWSVSEKMVLETGLRGDYENRYGFELLPRISALYRVSAKLSTRIGGGFGYKTPTVFTEEAERIWFRNLLPVDPDKLKNERSVGGNWDINYRNTFGDFELSINHLFFYTRLTKPLELSSTFMGQREFENASGYIDTKGIETNVRLVYSNFKLFIGYTFTDANKQEKFAMKSPLLLTARHRLNNVLMYEIENKLKLGAEAYYFSRQNLNDGAQGRAYWISGFMAEKLWKNFSIFINFENFTDTRQTKFDTIYTGTIENPIFRDIYAPVEGFVVNGGVKLKL
ncbi:MAG TPA: TonB-dependent receptor [Flavitalea sp.]|nr:TonB-dependent receptor [Flavitalea sp.]